MGRLPQVTNLTCAFGRGRGYCLPLLLRQWPRWADRRLSCSRRQRCPGSCSRKLANLQAKRWGPESWRCQQRLHLGTGAAQMLWPLPARKRGVKRCRCVRTLPSTTTSASPPSCPQNLSRHWTPPWNSGCGQDTGNWPETQPAAHPCDAQSSSARRTLRGPGRCVHGTRVLKAP
eukprot:12644525-Alexandrium_andersonii.AAC.1